MPGEGSLLCLLPEPAEGRQGNRGGIQSPADAPLPACDPTPERLFLRKTEQGKTAHLAKIVGNHIVGRRVCRIEGPLGRRAILPGGVFAGGNVPGGSVRGEHTEDVIVRSHGAAGVLGLERAPPGAGCAGRRGEHVPLLHRVVFVQSLHRCLLLTLRSPVMVLDTPGHRCVYPSAHGSQPWWIDVRPAISTHRLSHVQSPWCLCTVYLLAIRRCLRHGRMPPASMSRNG